MPLPVSGTFEILKYRQVHVSMEKQLNRVADMRVCNDLQFSSRR